MEEKNNPLTPKRKESSTNKKDEQNIKDSELGGFSFVTKRSGVDSSRDFCESETISSTNRNKTCAKVPGPSRRFILLHEKSAERSHEGEECEENLVNPRILEVSDERIKMASRKEFKGETTSAERSAGGTAKCEGNTGYEDADLLKKLPPDAVATKQTPRSYKEDSDYVRDSTDTSSGSSSATSGYRSQKVRRIQRAVRNKNRNNAEVRRNPMRVSKKDVDMDFPHLRQRLLAAKRRGTLAQQEATKRTRTATMPYMNTRSVTRKMYTVGATYQAPTKRDETEWKEWPVHGMHERPVYHPQVGLAAEYLGKLFVSLDGFSYHEIVGQPEIEIVSVDPRCGTPNFPDEKKRRKRSKEREGSAVKQDGSNNNSANFATCMHGSLHCVLAYCSQVMSPNYRKDVEEKLKKLKEKDEKDSNKIASSAMKVEDCEQKTPELRKEGNCTVASNSNVKNLNYPFKTNIVQSTLQRHFPETRKPPTNTIQLKNAQGSQLKLKEILRHPTKNLILLKTMEPKPILPQRVQQIYAPLPSELSLYKLEESAISDETLMEISSIYKNLVPGEENSPVKENFCKALPKFRDAKQVNRSLDFVPLRRADQKSQEQKENAGRIPKVADPGGTRGKNATSGNVATWYTSDASEIARILAEYNKGVVKKAAVQSHVCRNQVFQQDSPWATENYGESSRGIYGANAERKHQQDKWQGCRFAVDGRKGSTVFDNSFAAARNWQTLRTGNATVTSQSAAQRTANNPRKVSAAVQERKTDNSKRKCSQGSAVDESSAQDRILKTRSLSELLENTAVLYCAATGVHQDDLKCYIDSLDAKQSIQWLTAFDSQYI